MKALAPRALLRRPAITVELTAHELSILVHALEEKALWATDQPELFDFTDCQFRCAELQEAGR